MCCVPDFPFVFPGGTTVYSRLLRVLVRIKDTIASRPTLYRMGRIVELLKLGRKVTVATVADDLQVSPRTVARHLDYLVHVLDAPIEYDRVQRSFVLTEKGLPLILDPYIRSHLRQEAKRAMDYASKLSSESKEFVAGLAYVHDVIGRVLSGIPR